MRIDSHQHFWEYDPIQDSWITDEMSVLKRDYLAEDLLSELETNGIDAAVAVQAHQTERENLFLLDLAKRNRMIAGVVGWVNLSGEDIDDRLAFFSRFPLLRGFRHVVQDEPDDRFLLRKDFMRGIGRLKQFKFTYDILIYPRQLPAAVELTDRFPDQPFVIDHIAKPLVKKREIDSWAAHMRTIACNPRVYCKLSGLVTEAEWSHWQIQDFQPYLDVVFDAFGSSRLMFGSDWPVCLLAGSYRQVKSVVEDYMQDRVAQDKENVFGLNAARFYGLTN